MPENSCPKCGARMAFHKGEFVCPACDYVEHSAKPTCSPPVEANTYMHPLAMQKEKWSFFLAALALYIAGSGFIASMFIALSRSHYPGGFEVIYLIPMWSWLPTMVPERLVGVPYLGAAIAVLLVAAVQFLTLFGPSLALKYTGLVFAAVSTIWWAGVAVVAVMNVPAHFALACLVPAAMGAWGWSLLSRDIGCRKLQSDPEPAAFTLQTVLVEKWLFFFAGLALYTAGSIIIARVLISQGSDSPVSDRYLYAMWSWFPTVALVRLTGALYLSVAIAVLIVAVVQYLTLFRPSVPLKYTGLVFAAVSTIWWAGVAFLAFTRVVAYLGLSCLLPAALGAWGWSLLNRDLHWLMSQRSTGAIEVMGGNNE